MIYFLFGEDTYQIKEEADLVKKRFLKKYGGNAEIARFELPDVDFEKVKSALESVSFLFGRRLVIIKNLIIEGREDLKNNFRNYLKDKKRFANTALFIETGKVNRNDILFKELFKRATVSKEFNFFERKQLLAWVLKKVEEKGGKISREAASYLAASVGSNLFQINNEINKLVAFCGKKEIKKEDIGLLVQKKVEPYIFKTIDALGAKDKKSALSYLHEHLQKGDTEGYLRGMIAYQFRNILKVRGLLGKGMTETEMQKKSGLHSFVFRKTLSQAQNFDMERLKVIYNKLLKIDLAIKTSKIEPITALDLLVVELCE